MLLLPQSLEEASAFICIVSINSQPPSREFMSHVACCVNHTVNGQPMSWSLLTTSVQICFNLTTMLEIAINVGQF
jgi:hypothetical protein